MHERIVFDGGQRAIGILYTDDVAPRIESLALYRHPAVAVQWTEVSFLACEVAERHLAEGQALIGCAVIV